MADHATWRSFAACLLAVPVMAASGGCAGYQIGNQGLYPPHIRTVYLPVFESSSFRTGVGERLTEAVAKEIERRTPYKVVGDPGADSVLDGEIIADTKRLVVESIRGRPREVEADMVVRVSWTDRQGSPLRPTGMVPLPPELVNVYGTATVVPEVGQSVATTRLKAIQRLAEQIVSLMQVPW